jgi:hypothetical protein
MWFEIDVRDMREQREKADMREQRTEEKLK